jgi:hypothetical protein
MCKNVNVNLYNLARIYVDATVNLNSNEIQFAITVDISHFIKAINNVLVSAFNKAFFSRFYTFGVEYFYNFRNTFIIHRINIFYTGKKLKSL